MSHPTPQPSDQVRVDLRFRAEDWQALQAHLFPGDDDEHGAALLCGIADITNERGGADWANHAHDADLRDAALGGSLRLLVRAVVPAVDGVDYLPGVRGYRHLDGAFVTRQLRRAKDAGLVYLAVHNHAGSGSVRFSRPDLDSHERAYPTLLGVNGAPVGGLVLARGAVAGDLWMADGRRHPLHITVVVGEELIEYTDGYRDARATTPNVTAGGGASRYDRQALVFGEAGQRRMARLRVGIVGCGGVGMLAIQALARLGVGSFVLIDPDEVSTTNLSRLPEAARRDAEGRFGSGRTGSVLRRLGVNRATAKVDLGRRIIAGANDAATVVTAQGDVADDDVAKLLRGCDFIFLAADTMLARDVVNQLAYQYLIPTLQVGSKVVVDKETGDVRDVYGVVRSLGTAPGCLRCNGLVNMAVLAQEALADAVQRENQRYVDEPDIAAPSVITLNSMAVGWAVNDFMHYASGIGRPATGFRILRTKPVAAGHPQLVLQQPHMDPDCHVCGSADYSALAMGDGLELPTRTSRPTRTATWWPWWPWWRR